jgi:hypothetical protein
MTRLSGWVLPWIIVIAWAIPYGVAFLLPAADLGVTDALGRRQPPFHISRGWGAYDWAFTLRSYLWLANPLVWLAALLLVLRLWRWSGLVALAAAGVALSEVVRNLLEDYGSVYLSGYWLWAASMIGLGLSGLVGAWKLAPESQCPLLRLLFRRPSLLAWTAALLIVGLWAGGIALWYATDPRGGPSNRNQRPASPRWDSYSIWQNFPFFLVPIEGVDLQTVPRVEKTWQDLLAGMAADPKTQQLFRKLCNGADVRLKFRVIADAREEGQAQKVKPAPPPVDRPGGYLELRRRADVPAQRGGGSFANCLNVRVSGSLFLYLEGNHLEKIDVSPEIDLIVLLANDHLLRKQCGYQLRHGEVPEQGEFGGFKPMKVIRGTSRSIRAELDRQISRFVAQFRRRNR